MDEGFIEWWTKLEPSLLRVARWHLRSDEGAQDVVQDVAVLALRNADRFADAGEFQKWAYARLHWLVLGRRRAFGATKQGKMKALDEVSEPWALPTQLNTTIIGDLISKLPVRQRAVLERTLEGASDREIAETLNVDEATVRSLRRFARKRMSMLLQGLEKENQK